MDRRLYDRLAIKGDLLCRCSIDGQESMPAYIRNVSIMGMMVEVPDIKDGLIMDCCLPVTMDQCGGSGASLFSGRNGTLSWVYNNYLGIKFDRQLQESNTALRDWLKQHHLLCAEAS